MALSPCVRAILCSLSRPVIAAVSGIITAQVTIIDAEIAAIEVQLAALTIQLAPIQVLSGLVQTAIQDVQSIGNLVPVSVLLNCTDFGDVMVNLNTSLATANAAALSVEAKLNRYLSFQFQLKSAATFLGNLRTQLNDLNTEIQAALQPGGCP